MRFAKFEELSWWFHINAPKQYELILLDLSPFPSGFEYRTGFISNDLKVLIYAMWYLYGCRTGCVKLTEHQKNVLDYIKNVSQKEYATFQIRKSAEKIEIQN